MIARSNFKIGSSTAVIISLILLLLILFVATTLVCVWINPKIILKVIILITLGLVLIGFQTFTITLAANQAVVVLNEFNKKSRAIFEGFSFKLPWETVQYKIDLEAEISAEINEDFSTSDGKMVVKVAVVSKPDSGEGLNEKERSKHLLTFVRFELHAIPEMLKARAKEVIRPRLAMLTCEEARTEPSDNILSEKDFDHIAHLVSLRIIEVPVQDIDYSATVQKSRDGLSKATAVGDMVLILQRKGFNKTQATQLAPLLHEDTKLSKQIIELQGVELPTALLTKLTNLLNK